MHHHLTVNIPQNIISLSPALSGSLFSGGRTLRGAGAAVVLLACGVLTPVSARAATYTVISTNNVNVR